MKKIPKDVDPIELADRMKRSVFKKSMKKLRTSRNYNNEDPVAFADKMKRGMTNAWLKRRVKRVDIWEKIKQDMKDPEFRKAVREFIKRTTS